MEGDSLQSAETNREERPSRMVLTVTEDTPADMLAGSMELLVQLPRDHHLHTQRVTVQRSTPMMDLLVQIATAHKLAASSYTLQAIGERGLVLPHQPNTPIGALDALQVKLLPKQGTFLPRKTRQANQPFETTFRLQVHLPRNQLYVSRVSPKMNLGEILSEVCREKNLDRNKYELRHPANLEESLDLSLSLQDYHLQEVTLYAKQQGRTLGSALSSQDIMALQRQEERRRQQAKQSVFGFMFKKSKESSLSTDSLGGRSVSPARSDETGRSASPLQPPARPQRKRRPAPKPPVQTPVAEETTGDSSKDKMVISHSRNSSDSSGYHEASVLSDNPDLAARLPETLPRRNRAPGDVPRKLAHTSQSSKSLGNLAIASGGLSHGISSTSLSSAGLRKKRAAPPPPVPRPLSSAISTQALERIVDSEESLTSDMDPSKPPSDIGAPSKASSDIEDHPKASSDIGVTTVKPVSVQESAFKSKSEAISNEKGTDSLQEEPKAQSRVDEIRPRSGTTNVKAASGDSEVTAPIADAPNVETARVPVKRVGEVAPLPMPRTIDLEKNRPTPPKPPKRRIAPPSVVPRSFNKDSSNIDCLSQSSISVDNIIKANNASMIDTAEELLLHNDNIPNIQYNIIHQEDHELAKCSACNLTNEIVNPQEINELIQNNIDTWKYVSEDYPPKSEDNNKEFDNVVSENTLSILQDKAVNETISDTITLCSENQPHEKINLEAMPRHMCNNAAASIALSKSINNTHIASHKHNKVSTPYSNIVQDKAICSIISTIPKCDHLNVMINNENRHNNWAHNAFNDNNETEKMVEPDNKTKNLTYDSMDIDFSESENLPGIETKKPVHAKRIKIFRSQSKSNDFETNSFEKQKRYLTSDIKDIIFALNLNLSTDSSLIHEDVNTNVENTQQEEQTSVMVYSNSEQLQNLTQPDKIGTYQELMGISGADIEDGWTETDILLQKVSDTLSNSLPKSSSPLPTMSSKDICSTEAQHAGTSNIFGPTKINTEARLVGSIDDTVKDKLKSSNQKDSNVHEATNLKASAPNTTIGSQQDTSDYVSAVGEDLSISEWEYQLPAPPSAFRDRNSPAFDGYDTITLGSVEAFKEPVMEIVDQVDATECCNKNIIQPVDEYSKDSKLKSSDKQKLPCEEITIKEKTPVEVKSIIKHTVTNHVNLELKKEIISELESKIETGCLPQCTTKEFDTKRVGDRTSAPQIAPIDNTLSNFKITTYARQKSLNIYDDPEESHNTFGKSLDHRTVKSSGSTFTNKNKLENLEGKISTECFKRNSGDSYNDKNIINRCKSSNTNQNSMTFTNLEPKTYNEDESIQRQDSFNSNNEKTNVYRSKSYISMSNNEKYKGATQDYSEDFQRDVHVTNMRRSTSITNINVDAPRNNEKFSQWRDNILKRQEEPTKEKQLQSIQILKSILPQLKNAQQAEESVSKEHTTLVQEEPKLKIPPEENSIESNVELQQESETMSKSGHNKTESKKVNAKRYTYSGPPAINLGSWSERPSINVQIKMDTDYKLGTNKATSKTIVSIKNSMDEKDIVKATGNVSNIPDKHPTVNNFVKYNIRSDTVVNKKEPNDLARKLITHTTASGFKKPSVNKVHGTDSRTIVENEGRPIVTGVELKKAFVEKQEQPANRENDIDTSSVSFRELTKAFGQDISHKPKYKYFNTNRHSDYYDTSIQKTDIKNTENRFANCNKAGNQVDSTFKNSTAVNGIQNNLQPKKFTSVVGIHSQTYQCPMQNGTFPVRNNNTNKLNVVEPFVKGFRVHALSTDVNKANNHVSQNGSSSELKKTGSEMPKPPTMPVITGVTLKSASARPKSMPVQTDPRDSLLESIRNFGGREKLKSAASRY